MKKFFDKKVMDWKFKKAGDGHTLNEQKSQPQQPPAKSQPGLEICENHNFALVKYMYLSLHVSMVQSFV